MSKLETFPLKQTKNDYSNRNYQIDVLKILLTFIVFIAHTVVLLPIDRSDIIYEKYHSFGWVSVHTFFLISGFLMVKSILKRNYYTDNIGKDTIAFVINKFKPLALPFWIANAMFAFMYLAYYIYIYIYIYDNTKMLAFQNIVGEHFKSPLHLIINLIPEALCITNVGGMQYCWNNAPNWYICSLLFVMIPLCYFLIKKKESFIYVFSPVASILLLGYLKEKMIVFSEEQTFWFNLIRAVCGLCSGVVAWTIYNKLNNMKESKFLHVSLTIIESVLYLIFFLTWLTKGNETELMFPLLLLLPIAIAITFSEKSYISKLFKAKWLKHLGSISLYMYLNHYTAVQIARMLFSGKSYWIRTICAAVLTVILCIVCYIGVRIVNFIVKKIKQHNKILSAR